MSPKCSSCLAVIIPHRRPLCFWAESTVLKYPLAGAILLSSGGIPVRCNQNITPPDEDANTGIVLSGVNASSAHSPKGHPGFPQKAICLSFFLGTRHASRG
ncbi:hypothetical protein A0H81_01976 [Grifola frondosa]|uniref:Uncharacterized protein n=1 Tax=Grifola frondosa TaxID=5627 RepID=A0A1C7MLF4_GRIFR|nr:hypothetical protein A0H81_01976 [Grifola frondosa]